MKDRGNRKDVIVATKLGSPMGEGKQGLSRAYMVQAVEDSLKRLQTDYIDLYQAHRDDQETTLDEIMEAFDSLVKQGKIRWIGASNFTTTRLAEANAVAEKGGWARYESIQPAYHLLQRSDYEAELEPLRQKDEIGMGAGVSSRSLLEDHLLCASPSAASPTRRTRSRRSQRTSRCSSGGGSTVARR
ncbi:MAG TPA: aldo/keto reductase [Chloroflexota bacterium]|nr:aldo/keto reductase [Chloroflexota bacterium]